ncbi:hypothetical protein [Candidatus Laterigemmans baculatus]|uniref:hypothetical protein n=1 Tax=Candidatus Laterigemmans baculatus TaxID=2770505 RepID=UPI0013DC6DEB|nr:hypothetical protein [Candidatus Laterigemmans baculatus]
MPDGISQRQTLITAALIIIVLILNVASFGPYLVLTEPTRDRPNTPVWVMVGDAVFAPVNWLAMSGPEPIDDAIRDYCLWCYEAMTGEPF